MKSQYVWSPVYVDAMVLRDRDTNSNGVTTDTADERLYALQDANFNVTAVVDKSGVVQERYFYDPYGQVTVKNATMSGATTASPATNWVYLHQGTRFDITVGLYHNRNRDYSPILGRWISSDPLGFAAGDPNLYRANGNSPGNYVDPLGLRFEVGMDTNMVIDADERVPVASPQPARNLDQDEALRRWEEAYKRIDPMENFRRGRFDWLSRKKGDYTREELREQECYIGDTNQQLRCASPLDPVELVGWMAAGPLFAAKPPPLRPGNSSFLEDYLARSGGRWGGSLSAALPRTRRRPPSQAM